VSSTAATIHATPTVAKSTCPSQSWPTTRLSAVSRRKASRLDTAHTPLMKRESGRQRHREDRDVQLPPGGASLDVAVGRIDLQRLCNGLDASPSVRGVPGLGQLTVTAIGARDYQIVQGVVVLLGERDEGLVALHASIIRAALLKRALP